MQRLLGERFGLKVHRESHEIPVYVLVVGRNGPDLERRKLRLNPANAASISIRES